ncbi:MAG: DUF2797 domain-containing protein [Bergeyella sp.]|nr:DUF2797 domain-containing protein [Bergeyella sp.]
MIFRGQVRKMLVCRDTPVVYYLRLGRDILFLNSLIGKIFSVKHIGYQCVGCGSDKKIFRMGFCKKCFFESPYASDTIIRPELSKAHLGIEERDLAVEEEIQLQPHVVYLAYTGDVKVGVTRLSQLPARWIDQGAVAALPIARTQNRYEAGRIEVALKKHFSDKTHYKKMLLESFGKSVPDLEDLRGTVREYFPKEFRSFYNEEFNVENFEYPYTPPEKIVSLSLEKVSSFEGILKGIKGQYLYLDEVGFFNVRAHEGYVVEIFV